MLNSILTYSPDIMKAAGETIYMVLTAAFISTILGLPLGVILVVTAKGQILENRLLNLSLGAIINVIRSVPFIILIFLLDDVTRFIVGTGIGTTATIVPLAIAAAPFVARLVETSLNEVDKGVVEAALAMGANPWQIINKVLLPEAKPGLIAGITITIIALIGYSAIAGALGGGGLGDFAYRYGYQRYLKEVLWVSALILVIMVQIFQSIGDRLVIKVSRGQK
jgi:D-methionine transport system permease protein